MNNYSISEDIVCKQFEDESVLVNTQTGFYFQLNKVGSLIWKLMGNECSKSEIIDKIIKKFDINMSDGEKDYNKFIKELLEENLIIKK